MSWYGREGHIREDSLLSVRVLIGETEEGGGEEEYNSTI